MGQCNSTDAKSGKLSVKKILSKNKKSKKKNSDSTKKEDLNKVYPMAEGGGKKAHQKGTTTKGVAMSFGFKKRPTPMTAGGAAVAWDPNGNKETESIKRSAQKPAVSITPKTPTRMTTYNSHQNTPRMNDRNSNSPETEQALCRTFTRNVTIVTRTQLIESSEISKTSNDNKTSTQPGLQHGRFTLQTTRLPQPEPVRVIETKTAKTIANNNKRSARMWRRHEEGSVNITTLPGDLEAHREDMSLLDRLQSSDSFSGAFSPPPLPELPSVFDSHKVKETRDNRNRFLQSCSPGNYLKSRRFLADCGSPQGSTEQDWMISGGEAMAEDISLNLSPKHFSSPDNKLAPRGSLDMIDSLKESMHLTLSEEDPKFTAVATNNNTSGLLDDEILSPVESLLSSSDGEDLPKKEGSSDSKDINEKPTPTPSGSPIHVSLSLSLSDDNKEDFLIDDEIADQPELVFEDAHRRRSISPCRRPRLRNPNLMGSLESLSACESIGSEDLMLDFDNDMEQSPFPVRRNNFLKNSTPRNSLSNASVASPSRNKPSRRSSPDCRSPKINFNSFGFHSMAYDPASETLLLTKSNHSAVQQDIISIKTMLLTLKRILNESETEVRLGEGNNNNNSNEFKLELADLRRQVLFLQGQLEDKEKAVMSLRQQVEDLATRSTQTSLDNSKFLEHTSNAATQTDKQQTRAVSGVFSPVDENNSILRLMVN